MKRKVLLFICIVIFMYIVSPMSVLAGDLPESAIFDADFCFIGEVQKIENSICTLKISEVLFGEYSQDTIEIEDLKYWVDTRNYSLPEKGDYCAVVVQKSEDKFSVYQSLAAKADSLDKNTLKLESSNEFIKRMNDYINNGWYSNQTIEDINRRIKGKDQRVSSSEQSKTTPDKISNPEEEVKVNNNIIEKQDTELHRKSDIAVWIICAIVILGGILSIIIILNKRKK